MSHYPIPQFEVPKIAGYTIESLLGRGGMGVVWKAHQHGTNRTVAIKMIRTRGRLRPGLLVRFQHEAQLVSQVQDQGIVQIFHTGRTQFRQGNRVSRRPYLVMEYVEGGTLADAIRSRNYLPREAAKLAFKIAHAIGCVHRKGIVHRDLKPANILMASPEQPKVGDFGLAWTNSHDQVESGSVVGTVEYMSPEQIRGPSVIRENQPASDVFALGVILYELLVGVRPFQAETRRETLQKIWAAKPIFPEELRRKIPRNLQAICQKCLQKDPDARYPDGEWLADDLDRFLADQPVRARKVWMAERAAFWCRRNPLATALLVTLLCGVAGYLGYRAELQRKAQENQLARAIADERQKEFEFADYATRISQTERELESGNLENARESLRRCLPSPNCPDLRGWEWEYLNRRLNSEVMRIRFVPKRFRYEPVQMPLNFSKGGDWLQIDAEQTVDLRRLNTEKIKTVDISPTTEGTSFPRFAPKDRLILSQVAYSSDGKFAAIPSEDHKGEIALFSASRPDDSVGSPLFHEIRRIRVGITEVIQCQFDESARRIATIDASGTAGIHDLKTGHELARFGQFELGSDKAIAEAVAFGPDVPNDDEFVVVRFIQDEVFQGQAYRMRKLYIWNATVNKIVKPALIVDRQPIYRDTLSRIDSHQPNLDVSPGGEWIATSSIDGVRILSGFSKLADDISPTKGSEIRSDKEVWVVRFLKSTFENGDQLQQLAVGYGDGTVEIWNVGIQQETLTRNQKVATLRAHDHQVRAIAVCDSRRYIATSDDREIKLWSTNRYQDLIEGSPRQIESLEEQHRTGSPADTSFVSTVVSPDHEYVASIVRNAVPESKNSGPLHLSLIVEETRSGRIVLRELVPNPIERLEPRIVFLNGTSEVAVFGREEGRDERNDGIDVGYHGIGETRSIAWFYDLSTGKKLRSETGLIIQVHDRQGFLAARIMSGGLLEIFDQKSGRIISSANVPNSPFYEMTFHPNGSRLAILRYAPEWLQLNTLPSHLTIWHPQRGRELLNLSDGLKQCNHLRFSADGHRLFVDNQAPMTYQLFAMKTWDATPIVRDDPP